ncbi:MAG: hypothetical protein ACN4GZ_14180 [Acidimicrobiales bacterium]
MIGLETTDGFFIVVLLLGVVAIAAAAFAFRRRGPARAGGKADKPTAWRTRASDVCTVGREVIDLASEHDPREPRIGLTMHELGVLETKLDLLVGQVRDVQPIAPTIDASYRMSLVANHASSLNAVVRTERRVRLSSLDLRGQQLDTMVLEFVSERAALDDVIREMANELGSAR